MDTDWSHKVAIMTGIDTLKAAFNMIHKVNPIESCLLINVEIYPSAYLTSMSLFSPFTIYMPEVLISLTGRPFKS